MYIDICTNIYMSTYIYISRYIYIYVHTCGFFYIIICLFPGSPKPPAGLELRAGEIQQGGGHGHEGEGASLARRFRGRPGEGESRLYIYIER